MSQTLAHRGPDSRKIAIDGRAGVGHCLMRVNQEDLFEAQPIRDGAAGVTLVADCRIDNREELAEQFDVSPADLRDMPDSALVLRSYQKWGEFCTEHLLGDFAFAVWDGHAQKLVLARDHMGQRSVHYHRGNGFFAFATEIKALWAIPDVRRELDEGQLARFIVMDLLPRPGATFFRDIVGLPGVKVLTLSPHGECSLRRYWKPSGDPQHQHRSESYYVENLSPHCGGGCGMPHP
ncbi:MAG: hypothetical protein ACRECE_09790 [Xanthobacteraceae bacterium]